LTDGSGGLGRRALAAHLSLFFSSLSSVTDDLVPLVGVPLFLWLVGPACQRHGGSAAASLGFGVAQLGAVASVPAVGSDVAQLGAVACVPAGCGRACARGGEGLALRSGGRARPWLGQGHGVVCVCDSARAGPCERKG